MLGEGRDVFGGGVQEALRIVVRGGVGEQVDCGELGLLGRRDEEYGWAVSGVVDDGVVGGLGHGEKARRHVRNVEALGGGRWMG
eukprot:scaffold6411_cov152-Isochrysis_galbana.AAC.2